MDVPETAGAAAVGIGTDIAFGKALKTIGKGAKLLLTNLDKLSEPLLSKVKTVFKKALESTVFRCVWVRLRVEIPPFFQGQFFFAEISSRLRPFGHRREIPGWYFAGRWP
jgi:hypothetical protein